MAVLRKMLIGGAAAGLLTLGTAMMAGPALAATTGYPGTTTTTTVPSTTTTTSGHGAPGSPTNPIPVGTGTTITIVIGNGSTFVKVTGLPANTTISLTINGGAYSLTLTSGATGTVVFSISVTDPHISLDGAPPTPANYGDNTIALTAGTVTKSFIVNIPAAAATTSTSSSSSTSLAFTGADIAATVVGGLMLVALGTLLVVMTRRRSSRQHS